MLECFDCLPFFRSFAASTYHVSETHFRVRTFPPERGNTCHNAFFFYTQHGKTKSLSASLLSSILNLFAIYSFCKGFLEFVCWVLGGNERCKDKATPPECHGSQSTMFLIVTRLRYFTGIRIFASAVPYWRSVWICLPVSVNFGGQKVWRSRRGPTDRERRFNQMHQLGVESRPF